MTQAAIFDLDGTLIDTARAIVHMMRGVIASMGLPPVEEDQIRAMIGLPLEAGVAQFLNRPEDHSDVAECVRRYKAQFHDWLVPQARELIFAHVSDGLQQLHDAGFMLGVATSKHYSSAEAILKSAGLWSLFKVVAGADSVSEAKPHPAMALYVAQHLKCPVQHCVMIGDTEYDLAMGRAAGMQTCAVTYGVGEAADLHQANPDIIADNFTAAVAAIMAIGKPQFA